MSDIRGAKAQPGPAPQERRVAERLLVLALLRRDHVARWSRAELEGELAGVPPRVTRSALRGLVRKGVASVEQGDAWASEPTRALDELELICI